MASSEFVIQPGALPQARALRTLEFTGRLTFGAESERHYEELRAQIGKGARHFVFDLSRVPDVDSAGLGFLVACLTTILHADGSLSLAAPSDRVLYALLITRLDTVFSLFDSVEKALGQGDHTAPILTRSAKTSRAPAWPAQNAGAENR